MNLPRLLIAYKYVIRCIENFSIAIVYGLYYFGKGHLSQENYALYIRYDSLAQVKRNTSLNNYRIVTSSLAYSTGHYWYGQNCFQSWSTKSYLLWCYLISFCSWFAFTRITSTPHNSFLHLHKRRMKPSWKTLLNITICRKGKLRIRQR